MAEVLAGFTVTGGFLRSLVSAWLSVSDEICWLFTRNELHGHALAIGHAHMIEFSLFPLDYRSETDRLWVRAPGEMFAKTVRRFKIKEEVRVEVRDDNKFYVGPFKVGDVIAEEDVFEDFKPAKIKIRVDGRLSVVTADFRRMVKHVETEKKDAYENVGIKVRVPEATIIFFDEKESRMDLKGYEPWVVRIEGEGLSTYSLPLFSSLLILGLTDILDMGFQDKGTMELSYSGHDFWVKFWLAPRIGEPIIRFQELLVKPAPVRTALWVLREEEVKLLEKTVRSIGDITRAETFLIGATGEDLWIHWKEYDKGYFRVSRVKFWEWYFPTERVSGVFNISSLATWLGDVEELTCFLEGEPPETMMFVGKGAKIAPKDLRSEQLVKEIEVPEVLGIELFAGSTSILRDVVTEAIDAAQAFLLFASTPFEVTVLGRDVVLYRASLPIDAFQHVEEDYLPVNERHFKGLRDFFTRFPAPTVAIGKQDNNIYLRAENPLGELRALVMQAPVEVEDAIKAYKEEIERPPVPPEVKPLPEVVPPPPIEYVGIRFLTDVPAIVGADMKVYGPFKAGEIARLPKENAEALVRAEAATYELVPPPPPVVPTYEDLRKEFERLDPYECLVKFIGEYRRLEKTYLLEDLMRFMRELKPELTDDDIFLFYEAHPELKSDLVSIASLLIGWIPPPPPVVPPPMITPEEETRLVEEFIEKLRRAWIPEPETYRPRFVVAISRVSSYEANRKHLETIFSEIIATVKPVPPPVISVAEEAIRELEAL